MGLQETSIFFQKNHYRHYYLCPYLPIGSGIDPVSRSLLKFKRGAQPDLDNWLRQTLVAFQETPPALPPPTVLIRALHHNETQPHPGQPGSLDLLAQTLATQLQLPYLPGLLLKTRQTIANQNLTRPQREAELQNVYQINPTALASLPATNFPADGNPTAVAIPTSLLLIDDILTTGATILAILKTLNVAFKNPTITIFTLAKVA
ncbi:hypothetical protein [Puia sp.]|jgi:predicted amidophosphoribosyltransferase|uniref:ComF family protein n=1 Tax=Puia sp. TaxID=2045100 RepID=UPI002F426C6D